MDSISVIYNDNLIISASLTLTSGSYSIACGNILHLDLSLKSWGFNGSLTFVVSAYPTADTLLSSFQAATPIPISLSLVTGNEGLNQSSCVPISLSGIVCDREFIEIAGNQQANSTVVNENPVLYRKYFIRFEDTARFYWKQHYYQNLYANSTYQTVINAQLPSAVKLLMNWSLLTATQIQIFLNCGAREDRKPTASFYDWLIWLTDVNNGYFYYDYTTNQYNIGSALPAAGTATSLSTLIIASLIVKPASPKLSTLNIYNATAIGSSTKTTTNQNAVAPLTYDITTIQPIANNFTNYTTLQTNRFQGESLKADWSYLSTPSSIPVPGSIVQFQSNSNNISSSSALAGQTLRVTSVDFTCNQIITKSETENYESTNSGFEVSLNLSSCLSSSTLSLLPEYLEPNYPIQVEGTVCSTQGSTTSLTYSFATPSGGTANTYSVQVPVWQNVQVQVPYMPVNMNGQFYFPPYRNEQVLLSLGLNTANISAYLDWRSNAVPTMASQGNVIVMGQSDTSCTTINHSYSNNQPELTIQRVLGNDTETIQIGEGFILLETVQTSSS